MRVRTCESTRDNDESNALAVVVGGGVATATNTTATATHLSLVGVPAHSMQDTASSLLVPLLVSAALNVRVHTAWRNAHGYDSVLAAVGAAFAADQALRAFVLSNYDPLTRYLNADAQQQILDQLVGNADVEAVLQRDNLQVRADQGGINENIAEPCVAPLGVSLLSYWLSTTWFRYSVEYENPEL